MATSKTQATQGRLQFFDNNGDPLSGGTLTIYLEGTTTLATVYSDKSGTVSANPITLDSRGECQLYLASGTYKYVLADSSGSQIYTEDGIHAIEDYVFADGDSIVDDNNNELITFGVTSSAVNNVKVTNQATGADPKIEAIGDDTNINLEIAAKGTGAIEMLSDVLFSTSGLRFGDNTGIYDSNDNEQLIFQEIASAVNYFDITNAATSNAPIIQVAGDDTNISMTIQAKGTGSIDLSSPTNITGAFAVTGNTTLTGTLSVDQTVTIDGASTIPAELRLAEDSDNGTNYIGLKAPSSVASDISFTLPSADGSSTDFLTTDGSGVTSFSSINSLTADASPDGASDYLMTYDASASTHKKVLIDNLPISGGKVLQVVQTTKTDTASTTSTTFTALTGMSASITPSSTSSKILAMVSMHIGLDSATSRGVVIRLKRDTTAIHIGDASGSIDQGTASMGPFNTARATGPIVTSYLDSPATTSAVTYSIDWETLVGGTVYLNRANTETDDADHARTASSIILMEISG